jgi:hypothetical protein
MKWTLISFYYPCFLPWGDEPRQVVIKKLIAALINKKILPNLHLSNLFLIVYVEVERKKIADKIDFFSPPLTCASCLGGINQGRRN